VSTAPQLREELDALLSQGARNLTIDLGEMTFIDSTGLGVLVGALKRARRAGGDVTLSRPTRSARRVFDISGLSEIIPIVD
jgi:anti-sigma B factor antagonist